MPFKTPEQYRTSIKPYLSNPGDPFGAFLIPAKPDPAFVYKRYLQILASGGEDDPDSPTAGWDHVSLVAFSLGAGGKKISRTPTWNEMCQVKDLFWDAEDLVIQLHPPQSKWISNHPNCLHLWRSPQQIELPPEITVGVKGMSEKATDQLAKDLSRMEPGRALAALENLSKGQSQREILK